MRAGVTRNQVRELLCYDACGWTWSDLPRKKRNTKNAILSARERRRQLAGKTRKTLRNGDQDESCRIADCRMGASSAPSVHPPEIGGLWEGLSGNPVQTVFPGRCSGCAGLSDGSGSSACDPGPAGDPARNRICRENASDLYDPALSADHCSDRRVVEAFCAAGDHLEADDHGQRRGRNCGSRDRQRRFFRGVVRLLAAGISAGLCRHGAGEGGNAGFSPRRVGCGLPVCAAFRVRSFRIFRLHGSALWNRQEL